MIRKPLRLTSRQLSPKSALFVEAVTVVQELEAMKMQNILKVEADSSDKGH